MICYMPYTHIDETYLRILTGAFGVVTVYSPADRLVPEQMRQWEQEALLKIKHPPEVDGGQLMAVIREYKAWAEIHQGNIGDMAGFFDSRRERFAMMEDTNPSQIRHQVRHYGEPQERADDPLLNAVLFLALAQEFDTHQYVMGRKMDAVQAMEHQMMRQISGDGEDLSDTMPMAPAPSSSRGDQSLAPHMVSRRVRAWSTLAGGDNSPPWLYITPSEAVIDHVLDLFPEGMKIYHQGLVSLENEPMVPPSRLREMVQSLAVEPELQAIESAADRGEESAARLTLYRLAGVAPPVFLSTLGGRELATEAVDRQGQSPVHTLIGLVTTV